MDGQEEWESGQNDCPVKPLARVSAFQALGQNQVEP